MGRFIGVFERIAAQGKSPPYDIKQVLTDMAPFFYSNQLPKKMQINPYLWYIKKWNFIAACCILSVDY